MKRKGMSPSSFSGARNDASGFRGKPRSGGGGGGGRKGGSGGGDDRDSDRRADGRKFDRKPDRKSDSKPERKFERATPKPATGGAGYITSREKPMTPRSSPRVAPLRASLYGMHAVREAFLNPERKVRALYITRDTLPEFAETVSEAAAAGLRRPEPIIVEPRALDAMFPRGAVHQGLALDADELPEHDLSDLLVTSEQTAGRKVLLILDQVTDPHNVGAILRSACAFGALGVILQRRHAPEMTGVLVKAASGAAEHVPVLYETNLSRTIEQLKTEGFTVWGLDERGEIDLVPGVATPDRLALVLGAEGPGLRRLVKEHCDSLARLPMQGPIPSLNVSNAAAVALFSVLCH